MNLEFILIFVPYFRILYNSVYKDLHPAGQFFSQYSARI